MRFFLLASLLVLAQLSVVAQERMDLHDFEIFFSSNSAELSWEGEHALDSVVNGLSGLPVQYDVLIRGYSDRVGNRGANYALSQQRAETVKEYFRQAGFDGGKINHLGVGTPKEVPKGDQPEWRKVRIRISVQFPELLLPADSLPAMEVFDINVMAGANLETTTGTGILIPDDGFEDANGKPVTGPVTITYREYRNRRDFLLRRISMTDRDTEKIYDSVGMFEVRAYQNGKPISLRPGRRIGIVFGLNERLPMLDLMHLSDTSANWEEVMHITNQRSKVSLSRPNIIGCGFRPFNCFAPTPCERWSYLTDVGLRFANSTESITEQLEALGEVERQMVKPAEQRRDSLNVLIGQAFSTRRTAAKGAVALDSLGYKVERLKKKGKKTIFKVYSEAKEFNDLLPFDSLGFVMKGTPSRKLFKNHWYTARITLKNGKWATLRLADREEKIKLSRLKVVSSPLINERLDVEPRYRSYRKIRKARMARAEQLWAVADSAETEEKRLRQLRSKEDLIITNYHRAFHETGYSRLRCLWTMTGDLRSEEEKALNFDEWLSYFDEHKSFMRARFEKALDGEPESLRECYRIQRERKQRYEVIARTVVEDSTAVEQRKRDTIILPIALERLGIYNAARPFDMHIKPRLNKQYAPVEVTKYGDAAFGKFMPVAYALHPDFNGIYRFDGTNAFSPYRLPYRFQECSIIAFDGLGKANYGKVKQPDWFVPVKVDVSRIGGVEDIGEFWPEWMALPER